jgi:hypothetical protein
VLAVGMIALAFLLDRGRAESKIGTVAAIR